MSKNLLYDLQMVLFKQVRFANRFTEAVGTSHVLRIDEILGTGVQPQKKVLGVTELDDAPCTLSVHVASDSKLQPGQDTKPFKLAFFS